MSDDYSFDQNAFTRVLVTENWQNEQSTNFSAVSESNLCDSINESFISANDVANNTTQYYSVLDTSTETILNDMSQINMDVTRVDHNFVMADDETEIEQPETTDNQDVVLFRVDGSDELYGIQVAQDEEGNMQKYQFQVRHNEDGQLETIPGTIKIIPFEEEAIITDMIDETESAQQESQSSLQSEQVFIKQEINEYLNENELQAVQNEDDEDEENEMEDPDYDENINQDHLESKEGILNQVTSGPTNIIYNNQILDKEGENQPESNEEIEEYFHVQAVPDENETQEEEHPEGQLIQVYFNEEDEQQESDEIDPKMYEQHELNEPLDEDSIEGELSSQVEVLMPEDNSCDSMSSNFIETQFEEEPEDSDQDYVENIQISEDCEQYFVQPDRNMKSILTTDAHFKRINPAALKNTNMNSVIKGGNKNSFTYVIRNTEKENLEEPLILHTIKKNSRSILKSSVIALEEKVLPESDTKRFAKGKQAIQIRQFQNYISQTKIIEAPVRQSRLPRKQKIEPLERSGEEIVVQEVVVSSNGYIETREDGVLRERKPLVPSECIQLSDSEEELHKVHKKRKRRSKKSQIEIIISDSEDENCDSSPTKKSRSSSNTDEENITPPKTLTEIKKLENQCTKCPKSFPSAGALRTHMQYHNYQESNTKSLENISLKENQKLVKEKDNKQKKLEFNKKYQCTMCEESFRNNVLLTRHLNVHKNNLDKLECNICKKIFKDRTQLLAHKRSHVKKQVLKTTSSITVSPKRMVNKRRTTFARPEEKPSTSVRTTLFKTENYKCQDCSMVFTSVALLNIHKKTHKYYSCSTCTKKFPSKLLLDNHLHKNCVKSPSKNKISFVPPKRTPISTRLSGKFANSTSSKNKFEFNLKCDSCDMVFTSHTNLFKHKVKKHGLDTPDKRIKEEVPKKSTCKTILKHSGVPIPTELRKKFASIRQKLEI